MPEEEEFRAACELYMTSAFGGRLEEATQRRLYGLHARATRGPAPSAPPEGMAAEQWEAWRDAGSALSAEDAMEEYISAVELASLEAGEEASEEGAAAEGGGGLESLPQGLREQLEAAGLVPSGVDGGRGGCGDGGGVAGSIFEAARAGGDATTAFLGAMEGGERRRDALSSRDEDGLSALHHAVDSGHAAAVEALRAAEAPHEPCP